MSLSESVSSSTSSSSLSVTAILSDHRSTDQLEKSSGSAKLLEKSSGSAKLLERSSGSRSANSKTLSTRLKILETRPVNLALNLMKRSSEGDLNYNSKLPSGSDGLVSLEHRANIIKIKLPIYKCTSLSLSPISNKSTKTRYKRLPIERLGGSNPFVRIFSSHSWLVYIPNFLEKMDADKLFDEIYKKTPWVWEDSFYGNPPARKKKWYGDFDYKYSGKVQKKDPNIPLCLIKLMKRVEDMANELMVKYEGDAKKISVDKGDAKNISVDKGDDKKIIIDRDRKDSIKSNKKIKINVKNKSSTSDVKEDIVSDIKDNYGTRYGFNIIDEKDTTIDKTVNDIRDVKTVNDIRDVKTVNDIRDVKTVNDIRDVKDNNDTTIDKSVNDIKDDKDNNDDKNKSENKLVNYSGILINLYESGKHSITFHADSEIDLAPGKPISSVTLGQERIFKMRAEPTPENFAIGNKLSNQSTLGSNARSKSTISRQEILPATMYIKLAHGSYLSMGGDIQQHWKHGIDKDETTKPRINMTFRQYSGQSDL